VDQVVEKPTPLQTLAEEDAAVEKEGTGGRWKAVPNPEVLHRRFFA
jgi:hypothetical protein